MEDEYNTMPLDDTVAFDSPIAESELLNIDMNKEIVLDSDDEGGERNEAVNLVNGCFPRSGNSSLPNRKQVSAGYFRRLDRKARKRVFLRINSTSETNAGSTCPYNDSTFREHLGVMDSVLSRSPDQKPIPTNAKEILVGQDCQNRVSENLAKDLLDERKLSSHESNFLDTGKDANYFCDSSQLKYDEALGFVDHYLAVSDLGSYKNIETRKINRITSPPSLRSKGTQCLARRVNLVRNASELMAFDWAEKQIEKDEYISLEMNEDSIFGFEGEKSEHLSANQESANVNLQNGISIHSKDKLPGNKICTNDLDANSLSCNALVTVGSNSRTFIACDSIELEEQLDAGISRQNVKEGEQLRLTPDALDIGLDTQIAVEAMEELIHAAPPMFDPCFARQGSENRLLDSSVTVNKKSKPKNVANHAEAFVGWSCKEKRSKCVKISTVQDKNVNCVATNRLKNQPGTSQLPIDRNIMTEEVLNSRKPGNTRSSKCRRPPGITVQQEIDGLTESDDLKESQRVHCLYARRSKETTCELNSDSPPKRRQIISSIDDACKKGVKGTCLNWSSSSSFTVKRDTPKREENFNLAVSDSNPWIYPKRKRSRSCAVPHSIRSSNDCSPCVAIEKNAEKCPVVNVETLNRVAKLLVYKRRRKISLNREHTGSSLQLAGNLSSSVSHNATSDKQLQISFEFGTANPSKQCGKLDDEKPSSVDGSNNMKSDLLSNGNLKVFEGSDKSKQPINHLSRSPLMKELMRLGYAESLPDFLPKDSRKRRAMQKVCILFSQNLEENVLKQQRKIVGQLGFSIASCCSDATHFVTDQFFRTRNMLEAIALGKHVVTHLWLEGCEQAGYVIDEKSYILRDEKKEKEIGFNMAASLSRASQHPLFKGRRVLITPNVKPGVDAINSLVKAVHGQVVQSIPNAKTKDKVIPNDLLILSCEEDYTICLPFLKKGASIYNSELLLNGIVTQKLEYERYQLFKDFGTNDHS